MANNLYNSLQSKGTNPFRQIMDDARALRDSFKGNPKEEVQRLLDTGAMSQEQFNHYSRIARQISQMMGKY